MFHYFNLKIKSCKTTQLCPSELISYSIQTPFKTMYKILSTLNTSPYTVLTLTIYIQSMTGPYKRNERCSNVKNNILSGKEKREKAGNYELWRRGRFATRLPDVISDRKFYLLTKTMYKKYIVLSLKSYTMIRDGLFCIDI